MPRRRGRPLKVLEDIDSWVVWDAGLVSGPTDWPTHLFVKLTYTDYYDRGWAKAGKYHVEIEAVAPQAPAREEIDRALNSSSVSREEYDKLDDVRKCRVLAEYGILAVLWQGQGHNRGKLLAAAREEVWKIDTLFGFYMDRAQNAIGNTGWDWIRGDIGVKRKAVEQ